MPGVGEPTQRARTTLSSPTTFPAFVFKLGVTVHGVSSRYWWFGHHKIPEWKRHFRLRLPHAGGILPADRFQRVQPLKALRPGWPPTERRMRSTRYHTFIRTAAQALPSPGLREQPPAHTDLPCKASRRKDYLKRRENRPSRDGLST